MCTCALTAHLKRNLFKSIFELKPNEVLGHSSVVEHLPTMCKTLALILSAPHKHKIGINQPNKIVSENYCGKTEPGMLSHGHKT